MTHAQAIAIVAAPLWAKMVEARLRRGESEQPADAETAVKGAHNLLMVAEKFDHDRIEGKLKGG